MRQLEAGRVYRTAYFGRFGSNPTRVVAALVAQGKLERLQHGLYHAPRTGAFGKVPPSEDALLKARFGDSPYLRTGPEVWNALGLGCTAVAAVPLVYNRSLTGTAELGGRRFEFRRVRFPLSPTPEYFVVDLLQNTGRAGADRGEVLDMLALAVAEGRFDPDRLHEMAQEFGTMGVLRSVDRVLVRKSGC